MTGVGEDMDRTMGRMDGRDPVGDGGTYPASGQSRLTLGSQWGIGNAVASLGVPMKTVDILDAF